MITRSPDDVLCGRPDSIDRSIGFPDPASFVSVVRVAAARQLFVYKQELLASYVAVARSARTHRARAASRNGTVSVGCFHATRIPKTERLHRQGVRSSRYRPRRARTRTSGCCGGGRSRGSKETSPSLCHRRSIILFSWTPVSNSTAVSWRLQKEIAGACYRCK
jgi:hypothetical protein